MLGIISATRVPFLQPMPCSQAPNADDSVSSSANVIDLPMHVNAGRDPYLPTLSSNISRTDAYSLMSISAGIPFGYCLSQILSTQVLHDAPARDGGRVARRQAGRHSNGIDERAVRAHAWDAASAENR